MFLTSLTYKSSKFENISQKCPDIFDCKLYIRTPQQVLRCDTYFIFFIFYKLLESLSNIFLLVDLYFFLNVLNMNCYYAIFLAVNLVVFQRLEVYLSCVRNYFCTEYQYGQ